MIEVYTLLDKMLAKNTMLKLTTKQCISICRRYDMTGAQLREAIVQYCLDKDINLEEYTPGPISEPIHEHS